jgi:hypothetical protein
LQHGRSPISVKDLLDAHLLAVGQELRGPNDVRCRITSAGWLRFGGTDYRSPSTAASAVRHGTAVNGWSFWQAYFDHEWIHLADLRNMIPG